jgi:hypothetical protein
MYLSNPYFWGRKANWIDRAVSLPTALVRLRLDGSLPEWEKQAVGTWVPAN